MAGRSHLRYADWQRWRRLRANDRRETARAAVLVAFCALRLRLVGLRSTARWATRGSATPLPAESHTAAIASAVRAVDRVRAHSVLPGTCLSRSLALQRLLRGRGIPTDLRIGVRLDATRDRARRLDAHAWVEWNGIVLNDRPDVAREYAPL